MCIILSGPADEVLSLDLDALWEENPDGAGFVLQGQRVVMEKGLMTIKALYKALDAAYWAVCGRGRVGTLTLHLRWATHGAVCKENTHPFLVRVGGEKGYLFHNGMVCGIDWGWNGEESDTALLARLLSSHCKSWDGVIGALAILEELTGSRFALVRAGAKPILLGRWVSVGFGVKASSEIWRRKWVRIRSRNPL
ncbi:MAG: hypothetical protein V2G41_09225 [bacterium JZ-2024 1]